MDPRPTNYLRQNIVFSYPEMIRVSFSLLFSLSVFCYFTLLLMFIKIILFLLLFYLFIFMKIIVIFSCYGMFRNVQACSGMFHVPGFIDAPLLRAQNRDKTLKKKKRRHTHTSIYYQGPTCFPSLIESTCFQCLYAGKVKTKIIVQI